MAQDWTSEEEQLVYRFLEKDYTYGEMVKELAEVGYTRTAEAVRKFIKRHPVNKNKKKSAYRVREVGIDDILADKYHSTIDDLTNLRDKLFRTTTEQFIKVGNPVKTSTKILTFSDLHLPFINRHVIEHGVKNHSDADILVLNGDIFDAHLVSSWPREKAILLKWEYQLAVQWLKFFVSIFPKVVLISGNHEFRTRRYFSARIDPAVSFLTSADLLKRLAQGYDWDDTGEFTQVHTDFKGKVIYDQGLLNWYTLIGKCLFVHPTKGYSTVLLKTAQKAADHFLAKEDFQCLIMGHTHKQGRGFYKNRLLIEQGCCCIPLDYEAAGSMNMDGQIFGYATINMDAEGNVDFDTSRSTYVGTGSPVKVDDALRLL